ncbi:hypothetical protein CPB84DRAFT_1848029 [Gymnopilus junonius]|uniref:Uncharacterized protein n=1 Tax=Gymnopilus junonius TaxID=109634 RepID=A0A9P5NNW6_GYMJU|nr:hypothetical protein CPB84DRAFT_1848029 [Gymnopilus junonius]
MDAAYDTGRVGQVLERLAQERIDNPYAMLHLSEMMNEPNWATKYEPLHCGVPAAWRLIQQGPGGIEDRSNKEEVVVAIQGIVAKKDLPPFEEKVSMNSTHAQFLRQSVTLVGFHTPTFAKAVTNALELHAFLGRSVSHNNLEQCSIAPSAQEYPFSPNVDLKGYLAAAVGRTLAHIEDNIVQYYEMTTNYAGDTKFTCAKPIKVQVGDIVEVQVSIILVPL